MTKQDALEKVMDEANQIEKIIDEGNALLSSQGASFVKSINIAKSVYRLKVAFANSKEMKATVMNLANSRLGFMTDRSPAVLAANRKKGRWPQEPYSFDELVDPIVEGLLRGYRICGNEINIISGQFYAAKAGVYRMIIEAPGVSNFAYNCNQSGEREGSAIVDCVATWDQDGKKMSIGIGDDDKLSIRVKVNAFMGSDAILGKAQSKLFRRVLERITGAMVPESTDIDDTIPIDQQHQDSIPGGGKSRPATEGAGDVIDIVTSAEPEGMDIYGAGKAAAGAGEIKDSQDANLNNPRNPKLADIVGMLVDEFGEENVKTACRFEGFSYPIRTPEVANRVRMRCQTLKEEDSKA